MSRKDGNRVWIVAVLLTVPLTVPLTMPLAAPLAADDQAQAAAAAPAMSPDQQKMMDAMMKAATPGAEHQWLASMSGSWTLTGTSWSAPGAPPATFSGTAERSMILGGRVLVEKVIAQFEGMPFEGMGMTGFDNVTRKYWGAWNDNMSTGPMRSTGTCKDGKCQLSSVAPDPMSGKLSTGRMTTEYVHDQDTMAMYTKGPDGKEFKAMELHYVRKP